MRLEMDDHCIVRSVDVPLAVAYDVVVNIDADIPRDNLRP
jgi:hypothetical protein